MALPESQLASDWELVTASGGVVFRNVVTGEESIPKKRADISSTERHRKDVLSRTAVVADEDTRLGKKLLVMSKHDLEQRRGLLGSNRSILDRQKFWREFQVKRSSRGGVAQLVDLRTRKVIREFRSESQLKVYTENPHIQQVFANGRDFVHLGRALKMEDRFASRELLPRTGYKRRQGEVKTIEHWGQRKLLLSEIEFMLLHGHKATTVVYAGAAPGTHIGYLSELFPDHKWILVDPAMFDCKPGSKIEIRQTFFTDEMASAFWEKSEDVLFICDIRSMDSGQDDGESETRVSVDMEWQSKWVKTMKPKASMLKFRLPYPSGKVGSARETTVYLDGDIMLPVWGPRTTTETRLIVTDPDSEREYSHVDYEGYMFHHNITTRTQCYEHAVKAPGICHCFDCASEVHVFSAYLAAQGEGAFRQGSKALDSAVARMTQHVSRVCSRKGRTLALCV